MNIFDFNNDIVYDYDIQDFKHQIAGHVNEKIKLFKGSLILKPRNKLDLFRREVEFYEDSYHSKNQDKLLLSFLPNYYGVVNLKNNVPEESCPCIVLKDLTSGFKIPCVLDIKMGRKTFEPIAPLEKVERELKKYPYQEVVGFRITGVKIWDYQANQYRIFGKPFGRSLLPHQVIFGLAYCFFDGLSFRFDLLKTLIERCNSILSWMKEQVSYKFICTSLLVVYDASEVVNSDEKISVHMIDFAHALKNKERYETLDEEYIYGLTNLIQILEQMHILSHASNKEITDFIIQMKKEMAEVFDKMIL